MDESDAVIWRERERERERDGRERAVICRDMKCNKSDNGCQSDRDQWGVTEISLQSNESQDLREREEK